MEHTKGQLVQGRGLDLSHTIYEGIDQRRAVRLVATCQHGKDASRIVACVNALEGIENPSVFVAAVYALLESRKPVGYGTGNYEVDGGLLEQLRDLLARAGAQ